MTEQGEPGRDLAGLVVPLAGRLAATGDRWEPYRLLDVGGMSTVTRCVSSRAGAPPSSGVSDERWNCRRRRLRDAWSPAPMGRDGSPSLPKPDSPTTLPGRPAATLSVFRAPSRTGGDTVT